jgi:hypothetical protein
MKQKKEFKESLKSLFDCLLSDNHKNGEKLIKDIVLEKGLDPENFHLKYLWPIEEGVDSMLINYLSEFQSQNIHFIYLHYQFLESHLTNLFRTYEGRECCADKSRSIIDSLVKYYKTSEKINFNYYQEYTYHLPKKILKTHDDIISMFNALKGLYYGDNLNYFIELKKSLAMAKGSI